MRFGLMSGSYFVKRVKHVGCLSAEQALTIMCHIQCNDEDCGEFSVRSRNVFVKMLPYTISVSHPHSAMMT